MQIILHRRATCWTARFRGVEAGAFQGQELPLPYAPNATANYVYAEVGRRFPQARLFHVIENCATCAE